MKKRRAETPGGPRRVSGAFSWRRYRPVLRAWLIFLVAFAVLHTIVEVAGPRFWDTVESLIARTTAVTLNLLGQDAQAVGPRVHSSLLDVEIIRECTAVHPLIVLVSAILAFPCRLRSKLLGLGVGVPVLLLINLIRLVSLFYVGRFFPDAFDTVHLLVWQPVILFATAAIWIFWALVFTHAREIRPT